MHARFHCWRSAAHLWPRPPRPALPCRPWHSGANVAQLATIPPLKYFDVSQNVCPEATKQYYADPALADERVNQPNYGCKAVQVRTVCLAVCGVLIRMALWECASCWASTPCARPPPTLAGQRQSCCGAAGDPACLDRCPIHPPTHPPIHPPETCPPRPVRQTQAELAALNTGALLQREVIQRLVGLVAERQRGHVLLEGWTGSGKSVALYSLVNWARSNGARDGGGWGLVVVGAQQRCTFLFALV